MSERLKIWCNALFPEGVNEALKAGVGEHRLVFAKERATNLGSSAGDESLAEADIVFGQPDPDQLLGLSKLRWVQITSAGYTRYDRPEIWKGLRSKGVAFSNSSSVFDEPCAQHLLAFMLSFARALPQSFVAQNERNWTHAELRPQTRLLAGRVLLVGFGAIARRMVELLQPFNVDIVGVRRTVRGDEPIPTHPVSDLPRLLRDADHIVNILPSSPSSDGLFDRALFIHAKPGAVFYNIGRGTTVDQKALVDALESKKLGGAYLDVTDPEPLPNGNPLWEAPNCFITPHIGGGHAQEFPNLVQHFLQNLRRFESGGTLVDRVV